MKIYCFKLKRICFVKLPKEAEGERRKIKRPVDVCAKVQACIKWKKNSPYSVTSVCQCAKPCGALCRLVHGAMLDSERHHFSNFISVSAGSVLKERKKGLNQRRAIRGMVLIALENVQVEFSVSACSTMWIQGDILMWPILERAP